MPRAEVIDQPNSSRRFDPATALCVLRSGVGVVSWVSPALSWQTFGVGPMPGDARPAVMTRLFGAREFALAVAVKHPDRPVRRAALRAGLMIDSIDIVASLLAIRRGAPKAMWVTFVAGATLFVGLGAAALAQSEESNPG
jgi:hypothetical protein